MFGSKNQLNNNLSRKEKIALLREKHQPLFEKLGIPDALFIPKLVYGNPKTVCFFPSELKHERDIYIEMSDKEYNSEDETRTLYKWKYVPNYNNVYEQEIHSSSGDTMTYVPFTEFVPIVADDEADEFGIPNPDEDAPISELTIRDLTAILTGQPVSHKQWLNKIMRSTNGKN
jgi:hypothetical protein